MITFSTRSYKIEIYVGQEPIVYDIIKKAAALIDESDLNKTGTPAYVIVSKNAPGLQYLVSAFSSDYIGSDDSYVAIHLEESTHTLFIGAGTIVKTYDLLNNKLIFSKKSGLGFWSWHLLGGYVIQWEEIDFGVFNTRGERLWNTFISPPVEFEYTDGRLILKDCDQVRKLDIETGKNL